jgi:hypothetical protein
MQGVATNIGAGGNPAPSSFSTKTVTVITYSATRENGNIATRHCSDWRESLRSRLTCECATAPMCSPRRGLIFLGWPDRQACCIGR